MCGLLLWLYATVVIHVSIGSMVFIWIPVNCYVAVAYMYFEHFVRDCPILRTAPNTLASTSIKDFGYLILKK